MSETYSTPAALRAAVRAGRFFGPTAGQAPGYVQANVVILPARESHDFAEFCRRNARACPLLTQTQRGIPEPVAAADGADLRTDVPRYRVFRNGVLDPIELTDVTPLWRDDLVGFLLGCSFTFEAALVRDGLEVRHLSERRNVSMYRTNVACEPAGRFAGPLVVTMRPFPRRLVDRVTEITGRFPTMHGAPVHVGSPAKIGIKDLARPDFGDAVSIHPGEVPVFWACGVTPQLAMSAAKPEIAITHSPGCMFVTDWRDEDFCTE